MGKLFDVAIEWLNEDDWSFEENHRDDGNNWTRSRYKGENATFDLVLDAREHQEVFYVYIYWPIVIPVEKRLEVAELITRINYGLMLGNFELDMRDGEIRYKVSVDVEGSQLVSKMIENMVRSALGTSDRYAPAVLSCCYGDKTPLDALKMLQSEEIDETTVITDEAGTLQ